METEKCRNPERREFCQVCVVFLTGVIIYGVIASLFTATVHVNVDEELYVSLAKSFYYTGQFQVNGSIVEYNCVLYSLLISLAYIFYSPEHILFFMRLIGVVCICSSVFPIWLLAKKILKSPKEALQICVISMFLPYMFDCVYLMQEVLSYSLFLWTAYFIYLSYEHMENTRGHKYFVISAVFSVLCFFTKTYLFIIPVIFNLHMFWIAWKKRSIPPIFIRLGLYDISYLILTGILYILIGASSGFVQGSNHYVNQFTYLFPITGKTIISAVFCMTVYAALLLINTGIFPALSIFINRNKFKKTDKLLTDFILILFIGLIIETVVLIVLTEERAPVAPHKFLFRYFQILVPIILTLFSKVKKETAFFKSRAFMLIAGISILICSIYFVYMNGNTRQAIADGYFYLLLENITKYILSYGDVISVLILGGGLLLIIILADRKKLDAMKILIKLGIAGIACMWLLNCIQLPIYTNFIADGRNTQEDSLKIAQYLNENEYDFIYFVADSEEEVYSYSRNFYGYMKQPHQVIYVTELENVLKDNNLQKTAFLLLQELDLHGTDLELKELDTKKIMLYTEREFTKGIMPD